MKKNLIIFVALFAVGCVVALAARSALYAPDAGNAVHAEPASHAGHEMGQARASAEPQAALATVNSVCAICGMDVDPSLPPAEYKGKLVGFGCRMCPPKFAADPDRWGPAALENRIVE